MRIKSLFNILLFSLLLMSCKQTTKNSNNTNLFAAQVIFNDSIHNFGTLNYENATQYYDFSFKNSGDIPVVILHTITSCNCTTVEYSNKPVMPCSTGIIRVHFDGKTNGPGYFNKNIKVRFNSERFYELKIRGKVIKK